MVFSRRDEDGGAPSMCQLFASRGRVEGRMR